MTKDFYCTNVYYWLHSIQQSAGLSSLLSQFTLLEFEV